MAEKTYTLTIVVPPFIKPGDALDADELAGRLTPAEAEALYYLLRQWREQRGGVATLPTLDDEFAARFTEEERVALLSLYRREAEGAIRGIRVAAETEEEALRRTRTAGFLPLIPGRIHTRCPRCDRRVSNAGRAAHEPERAALVEHPCKACVPSGFAPDSFPEYYDADGRPVDHRGPSRG